MRWARGKFFSVLQILMVLISFFVLFHGSNALAQEYEDDFSASYAGQEFVSTDASSIPSYSLPDAIDQEYMQVYINTPEEYYNEVTSASASENQLYVPPVHNTPEGIINSINNMPNEEKYWDNMARQENNSSFISPGSTQYQIQQDWNTQTSTAGSMGYIKF